ALSRLIARCLEKDPDDRVQTARDIYNELRHVQKQLQSGLGPRPDSRSARAAVNESLWLAVLPFMTRGTDPDGVSLAAGLTEDITAGLARFPSLSVVAHRSALGFKGSPLDIRANRGPHERTLHDERQRSEIGVGRPYCGAPDRRHERRAA